MNRTVMAALLLAVGFTSTAGAYYVDMASWSMWATPASYITISYGDVAKAPDTIEGNNYGAFSIVHPPSGGDYGNIYLPLTTQVGWVAGNTYAISFDIKILEVSGYNLRSQFYTRPKVGMDGSWVRPT